MSPSHIHCDQGILSLDVKQWSPAEPETKMLRKMRKWISEKKKSHDVNHGVQEANEAVSNGGLLLDSSSLDSLPFEAAKEAGIVAKEETNVSAVAQENGLIASKVDGVVATNSEGEDGEDDEEGALMVLTQDDYLKLCIILGQGSENENKNENDDDDDDDDNDDISGAQMAKRVAHVMARSQAFSIIVLEKEELVCTNTNTNGRITVMDRTLTHTHGRPSGALSQAGPGKSIPFDIIVLDEGPYQPLENGRMVEISFFCQLHEATRFLGVKKEGDEYRLRCCEKPAGEAPGEEAAARSSSSSISPDAIVFEAVNQSLQDEMTRDKYVLRSNLGPDLYLGLMEGSTSTTMVIGIVQGSYANIKADVSNRFALRDEPEHRMDNPVPRTVARPRCSIL